MQKDNSKNITKQIKFYRSTTVVFLIILIIVLSFSYHSFRHQVDQVRYPLINASRHASLQKDFITNIQPLRKYLSDLVIKENLSNRVSIYFEYLNTGANISINKDVKIFPASLAKLPIAMLAFKKVEMGVWSLDTKITILPEDINPDSGTLHEKGAGYVATVDELVTCLLEESDNTSYMALKRNMTSEELVNFVYDVGIEELVQADGKISAKEYARFFRALHFSSYLDKPSSQRILMHLTKTPFNTYIQSGLPDNVVFAHKIGENYVYNSFSDAGIVYLKDRPYMLAIMYEAERGAEDKAKVEAFMQQVSSKIYQYIANK